ncbi:MAG: 3-methyl-2-oxobutanoate hydroxymethyltransferase [Desulfurococcales archaeon ex4484_204]|nr:MAG: 3-methyl-2-oxobutanoate hydroxymethyltransferase [Desulfurococcales archaeon ex4484_204]
MDVMEDKIQPHQYIKFKKEGIKIVMVTAYDSIQARIADGVGVHGILVGDSLGMVIMGYSSTLPVTLNDILHHLKAVLSVRPKPLVVADMPFLSYEVSRAEAVRNAGRLVKAGADAVKVEGGVDIVDKVEAMVKAGIPVMGHIGLNPQRYLILGGYKLRGKRAEDALLVYEDAKALEEVGVFSIVIEFTAADVAKHITDSVSVPTICIGSGPYCDGQILVFHDIVGLNPSPPLFVKKYANVYEVMVNALMGFKDDVQKGLYPTPQHYKLMKDSEYDKFVKMIKKRQGN